jgi:hypothetical protein
MRPLLARSISLDSTFKQFSFGFQHANDSGQKGQLRPGKPGTIMRTIYLLRFYDFLVYLLNLSYFSLHVLVYFSHVPSSFESANMVPYNKQTFKNLKTCNSTVRGGGRKKPIVFFVIFLGTLPRPKKAQKVEISWPTPCNGLSNGFAPIKNLQVQAPNKKNRYIGSFLFMSFNRCHFRAQKSLDFQCLPLPMSLVMDLLPSRGGAV